MANSDFRKRKMAARSVHAITEALAFSASTFPARTAQRRRTPTNHREMDRTIAQRFIGSVHSVETRILRFRIEHLRGLRVEETWLLAQRPPSDIGRSAGDAVVHEARSPGR